MISPSPDGDGGSMTAATPPYLLLRVGGQLGEARQLRLIGAHIVQQAQQGGCQGPVLAAHILSRGPRGGGAGEVCGKVLKARWQIELEA